MRDPQVWSPEAANDATHHVDGSLRSESGGSQSLDVERSTLPETLVYMPSEVVEPTRPHADAAFDVRYRLGLGLLIVGCLLPLLTPLEWWVLSELQYRLYPSGLAWISGFVPFLAIATYVAGWLLLPAPVRRGLLVPAASAGAVLIIFLAGPIGLGGTGYAPPNRSDDVSSVLADARANNSDAKGAPQQAVVNGWAARDLLALQVDRSDWLIAQQAALLEQQQRTNQLLLVGILAIVMVGLGVVAGLPRAGRETGTPEPAPPGRRSA